MNSFGLNKDMENSQSYLLSNHSNTSDATSQGDFRKRSKSASNISLIDAVTHQRK